MGHHENRISSFNSQWIFILIVLFGRTMTWAQKLLNRIVTFSLINELIRPMTLCDIMLMTLCVIIRIVSSPLIFNGFQLWLLAHPAFRPMSWCHTEASVVRPSSTIYIKCFSSLISQPFQILFGRVIGLPMGHIASTQIFEILIFNEVMS